MEAWDLYDAQGRALGRQVNKGAPLPEGTYHLAAEAWLVDGYGRILIQQRSARCEILPSVWGLTTGRMLAGEDSLSGCLREVQEELGITVAPRQVQFLRRIVRNDGSRLIWDIYRIAITAARFALQAEEVARVRWVTPDMFRALLRGGELYAYPEIEEVLGQVLDGHL